MPEDVVQISTCYNTNIQMLVITIVDSTWWIFYKEWAYWAWIQVPK